MASENMSIIDPCNGTGFERSMSTHPFKQSSVPRRWRNFQRCDNAWEDSLKLNPVKMSSRHLFKTRKREQIVRIPIAAPVPIYFDYSCSLQRESRNETVVQRAGLSNSQCHICTQLNRGGFVLLLSILVQKDYPSHKLHKTILEA
jgi:hypothetical protein